MIETTGRQTRTVRRIGMLLVAGVAIVGVVLMGAWFGQRGLIYFPDRSDPGSAVSQFARAEDVSFTTQDGLTLSAWLVEPEQPREVAVLYLPGNGGNRLLRAGVAQALADEGFTVLLVDYRGYGGNPGRPSEEGLALDALAAASWLRGNGFPADRTIYLGESIGTGVAARLAASDPPAGLVLRSPYTSLPAVAEAQFGGLPIGRLVRDRFDTLSQLPGIDCPVSVLAGADDTVIPASQSEAVARQVRSLHEHVELAGVGHNDAVWFGPYLAERVGDLARAAVS